MTFPTTFYTFPQSVKLASETSVSTEVPRIKASNLANILPSDPATSYLLLRARSFF